MEPDFGVIYEVQKVDKNLLDGRTQLKRKSLLPQIVRPELPALTSTDSGEVVDPRPNGETIRRKSVSSKAKEVVTIGEWIRLLIVHHTC
jgi:hypothetical protein